MSSSSWERRLQANAKRCTSCFHSLGGRGNCRITSACLHMSMNILQTCPRLHEIAIPISFVSVCLSALSAEYPSAWPVCLYSPTVWGLCLGLGLRLGGEKEPLRAIHLIYHMGDNAHMGGFQYITRACLIDSFCYNLRTFYSN
jgi:hypothetical protein